MENALLAPVIYSRTAFAGIAEARRQGTGEETCDLPLSIGCDWLDARPTPSLLERGSTRCTLSAPFKQVSRLITPIVVERKPPDKQ